MPRVIACLLALTVIASVNPSLSGVPPGVSYQGRLTDSSGNPVVDGAYSLRFSLVAQAAGGAAFWSSPVLSVTTGNGLFTTTLEPLSAADLIGKDNVWLEAQVGSPPVTLSPRVKLTSSPFALRAGDLDMPFSGTSTTATQTLLIGNTGTGKAGYFQISSAANTNPALYATTNGTGYALTAASTAGSGAVRATTSGGTGTAVNGYTDGSGPAGYFQIDNAANNNHALIGTTNGGGSAVYASTGGTGNGVYGRTTNSGGYGVRAANTGGGTALYATSNGGSGEAVYGYTDGTGSAGAFQIDNAANSTHALIGTSIGSGSAVYASTSGTGNGVYGRTTNSAGYGVRAANTGGGTALYATSNGGSGEAVNGYTDGTGNAGYFQTANAANGSSTLYAETNGTGRAVRGHATGSAWAGYFTAAGGSAGKGVYISVPAGNAGLNVASGTKNAVVTTSSGARLMYTEESAEVWFTDYGFGRLQDGRATVAINRTFAETVDLTQPYHVFMQVNDLNSTGVGVVNKTPASFEVGELQGGKSDAEFSYRIVAKRRGYEQARLERAPYADDDENLYPQRGRREVR
ncbi:MAG: hypothetical protein HY718_19800 [Planctomycetes bacterium]|nr:hypothetical protein [Planctomycetota bacterium]